MRKQIITLLSCLVLFTSCNDFLTRYPFTNINEDLAIIDNVSATYALLGVYNTMQGTSLYSNNLLVVADACTDNVILSPSNSGRFINVAQWQVTPNSGESNNFYPNCYTAINSANRILLALETDKVEATEEQLRAIKGEALAARGLMHFEMVRYYGQAYWGNEDSMGIPYMFEPTIMGKPARDNVRTVYNNIIADLLQAISLVTPANSAGNAPYRMDHWSIKALLARVYLAQLDYDKAKPLLVDIINNSEYTLLSNSEYVDIWSKQYSTAGKADFMFAIANNSDDYGATGTIGYNYVQSGYMDCRVSSVALALFDDDDVRKELLVPGIGSQLGWTFVFKFPSREGFNGLSDIPVMRFSDVCLMYAEVCAYTGDEATAIEYLDKIRFRAQPSAQPSTETGEDLKEKIFLEMRKEFIYEGHYYHDLKRYHKTINSAFNGAGVMYTTITYPNTKLAYPIPIAEMDANPNMVQNPGY